MAEDRLISQRTDLANNVIIKTYMGRNDNGTIKIYEVREEIPTPEPTPEPEPTVDPLQEVKDRLTAIEGKMNTLVTGQTEIRMNVTSIKTDVTSLKSTDVSKTL